MPTTPYNRAGPGQPIPSYDDWNLQHRGTMAPWGVYEKDGQTASGFAWPAMVTDPVEAGKRFLSPGGGFENLPNQQSEQDALTLLMSLYGGNALSGTVKGSASAKAANALATDVGMFAGQKAATADLNALARAEKLAGDGATRDAIWNETGWFHGPDQKWRFEIDDSKSRMELDFLNSRPKDYWPLGDAMKHDDLFAAYPDMADGKFVKHEPFPFSEASANAYHMPKFNEIALNDDKVRWKQDALSNVLHEGQHVIQGAEGFASGGGRGMFTPEEVAAERQRLMSQPEPLDWSSTGSFAGDTSDSMVAHNLYRRLAGEVEARNVQKRDWMSPGERRATPPWETQDVPYEDQIVRLLSDTGRPNPLGSAIASGAEQGKPIRAYHGTRFASEPLHTYPVTDRMASAGDTKVRLWASSDADVASSYAEPIGNDLYWDEIYPRQTGHTPPPRAGGVFPVEMNFTNPLEVDAAGAGFQSVPWGGLIYPVDELAYVAQNMGHDGLIVKSLQDHMYDQNHAPSTVYAALKRGTVRSPLTGETLFSDTRPSLLGSALASEQGKGITAYHGSPHSFDKFDMSKIGSGEGAQAFGHGLYFAESEGVAKGYRDHLAPDHAKYAAGQYKAVYGDKAYDAAVRDGDAVAAQYLEAEKNGTATSPGHMYQVRINANPEDFLDWDKPLSQQSEKARNALASRFADDPVRSQDLQYEGGASTPSYILRNAADAETTKALREAGIPGIKYLDQMSRTAGDGSRNYVVFDDNLVEIMKKYGLAGALYGGTNSLYQEEGK